MLSPQSLALRFALAAGLGVVADPGAELRVLRVVPSGDASPTTAVTVTFDRPVAGSLDRTVDPGALFAITPAVAGAVDWRDPVTLRFRPAAPLTPNTSYTVTVANSFAAMDGSRLREPYAFTFRVRGPRVLAGSPIGPNGGTRYLAPDARFDLVVDAPVDPAAVEAATYVEFNRLCSRPGVVRLAVEGQRAITADDRWDFREAGGWDRDRSADPLRRVVRLAPRTPLAHGCAGDLVLPAAFDQRGGTEPLRWGLATYGDFRLARAGCGWEGIVFCPTGPLVLRFSTPVRGSEVQGHVALRPAVPFELGDTADVRADWVLDATLKPHTAYAVVVDGALRDEFDQALTGNPVATITTTGYAPAINYAPGRAVVERKGAGTFALTFVNVDTLEVVTAPVPDSLEAAFLARSEWRWNELWPALLPTARRDRIPVTSARDRVRVYGVKLAAPEYRRPGTPTLLAVQVTGRGLDSLSRRQRPIALLQVTDLGVHARVGSADGVVWVTGASDGRPRAGAAVALHDAKGRIIARSVTDTSGIARLTGYGPDSAGVAGDGDSDEEGSNFQGYVSVVLGTDRALLGINDYDPDLSPWRFNVTQAWGSARLPVAAAVFTERGIYRPGEPLFAKAIVRTGSLGALARPAPGDSLRWRFEARADDTGPPAALRDTTVALSAFGTADQRFTVPAAAPLGVYRVVAQLRRGGRWTEVAAARYRVAEYRPPEFLVDVTADTGSRYAGDSVTAGVEARYLFGAPMGRAAVRWTLRQQSAWPDELEVPGTDGYYLGETGWWYEESVEANPPVQIAASGVDTLDATGHLPLRLKLGETERGRPSRATLEATVVDVNRQTVSASASLKVHPADVYLAAKPEGAGYFWSAGTPVRVGVLAVRPDGVRVPGVRVTGTIVRREWHSVRRDRAGYGELVGEWVSDTVARCALTTAAEPASCGFTPPAGGTFIVTFRAADAAGRLVSTSFYRWATGKDWVPWNDESQFKMDVIPDRARYTVGDTATILFASPFTNAEAWITVEREGLLQQRRLTILSGTTTLKLPVTEALAPNAFVSIVVARGRSARPGPLDDPGRPTIRVGYAELRITPERKRLTVEVKPLAAEYRPGDTARVALQVRDADGQGQRTEVTLWAVDQGVLALTGYRTPDPIDLLYQPRGLGLRLASTLTTVAPQVAEGEKGRRAPGGGGGRDAADILRSRFQTTAFFLGSVVTDAAGRVTAAARLPDNLTTFRLMAVAVTAGDRYGSGQSSLLVTRPLVARPALPRFLREGDRFAAGVVVNRRDGAAREAKVAARALGAELKGKRTRSAMLVAGRGREVRFDFQARPGDSASFRFDATSGPDADAVALALPLKPAFHPRSYTVAGVLHDTASAELLLPADIDPTRSTLQLSLGTSPLAMIRGARQWLRIYPYWCSEQVASAAKPLVALLQAGSLLGDSTLARDARIELARAVATLSRRQRSDGGIGLWSGTDWTTPWLTAYAGGVLLDAREAGLAVDDSVLARLGVYLTQSLTQNQPVVGVVSRWYASGQARLSDRVRAVDYLSRAGLRDRAAENELLRLSAQLAWEDRVRLALVLARGGDRDAARSLLEPAWRSVRIEGRTATLPPEARRAFYFDSRIRPAAYLLGATIAVEPAHPLVGPLVETLVAQGRGMSWVWNTQDYGTAIEALVAFQRRQQAAAARGVRVSAGSRVLLAPASVGTARDSSVSLRDLVERGKDGTRLRLRLEAGDSVASTAPVFYYLTVTAVPKGAPVRPDERGVAVERWYERFSDGKPITEIAEGELLRVRLRVTVPTERHFVVLDDALPAGLEAVDLSLRTAGGIPGPGAADSTAREAGVEGAEDGSFAWEYGSWDAGWWSPFDHKEMRDDKVVYVATQLWPGSYTATYVARATTPGVFVRPPAHAEEMYNPAVFGESDGGVFTVTAKGK
jgi:alpha-2-macroglobulin